MIRRQSGFSLIETMIVLIIVMVVSGAIFQVINLATQRSSSEQNRIDLFQEAREFMDQMSRDLRQAGYPSPRNMDPSVFSQDPIINDLHAAAGLVKISDTDLWFEGDVEGDGTVYVIRYHLDTSTTNNCPCLKRSQLAKIDGDPVSGQTAEVYQVEVQGVQNTNIFSAYNNGTALTLPLDAITDGASIASIDTVQALLSLQSSVIDPQTRQKPVTTLVTTVRLNNCSQAAIGNKTSCQ